MFFGDLSLSYIDGRSWRVNRPLKYVGTRTIYVPAGFVTDFASIPRLLWRVLPPTGDGPMARYGPASVLHDWLYQSHETSRWQADLLFYEAMRNLGVSRWRACVMWCAVKLFGACAYKSGPGRFYELMRRRAS